MSFTLFHPLRHYSLELMWVTASNRESWMALWGFRALWVLSCVTPHTRRGDVASAGAIVYLNWTLGGLSIATGQWHKPSQTGNRWWVWVLVWVKQTDWMRRGQARTDRSGGRYVLMCQCAEGESGTVGFVFTTVSVQPRLPQDMMPITHKHTSIAELCIWSEELKDYLSLKNPFCHHLFNVDSFAQK